MTTTGFSALCNEFTDALTEVLAENAVGLAHQPVKVAYSNAGSVHRPWPFDLLTLLDYGCTVAPCRNACPSGKAAGLIGDRAD
jgi:hypothetical protein